MSDLILVVDDDTLTRIQLRELLRHAQYRVIEAKNGAEGIDMYVQHQPDMVLLDAMMPQVDGFTCCDRLRKLPNGGSVPILMITALYEEESVERAFAVGATDYITKPIHWSVLSQRVKRLLEASQAIAQLREQTQQAQSQEEHLRMALEAANMGTWEWDICSNKVSWSENKEALFGMAKGSFDGNYQTFIERVHPSDRSHVSDTIEKALNQEAEYDIEFRVILPSGKIRWMASKGDVFYNTAGSAVRMSGIDIDITKRKQSEAVLEVYANRQAMLAELGHIALAGTDLTLLMEKACNLIVKCLGVEYAKVLEKISGSNDLVLRTGVGWQSGVLGMIINGKENSQAGYTLLNQEPVVVRNLATETRFQGPALLTEHQVVSGISVVINGSRSPFGVLGAHTKEQRDFNREDIFLMQAVANTLATAIERKRTESALVQSRARLELINAISTNITAGMLVGEIIENTLKLISVYFPSYRVSYSTVDPNNKLRIICSIQPPTMPSTRGIEVDLSTAEKYLQELRQSKSVIIEDITNDPRVASLADVMLSGNIGAVLDVPLHHSEQLVGLLCFDSSVTCRWSEHEIITLEEVADYLSVAIREGHAQQERRSALDALQESKERFSLALKGTNDGIWDWNIQTSEVFFSARWKQMLGYEEDEIGNHIHEWIDRIHPLDVDEVMEVMYNHFAQEKSFYISEYRLQCKDGSYKWILDRGQALWDENGNVVRMAGSHTDITERKLSEEKLRQSEERLQIVARATNDVVWDWDLCQDQTWWNENVRTLFGYSTVEIKENPDWWYEHIHPEDKGRTIQDIHQAIDSGKQFWFNEYRFQRLNGTYAYILDRGYVVHNHGGEPIRMIGAMMDISDRKRYQEELQRQNLRSQLFADVTVKIRESLQVDDILHTSVTEVQKLLIADRVLILRLRSDKSVTIVKEAVVPGITSVIDTDIFDPCFSGGYVDKYSQGRISAITDIEKANIRPCHVQFLKNFDVKANLVVPILLQNELWGLLITHQCSRPREWTSWETQLLRELADQIGIALAQSKLLEQETRQRQELATSNEELQQFAFIASHDLQEPLRKIKAFGDRLESTCHEALTEQGRDYLSRMQNASVRMQTLIDDLLTLSRIATKAQPLRLVNLTQIVEEVLSDLEIRIQQTNGTIKLDPLPKIKADPLQMRQLLQNLVGNALKFHLPNHPPVVEISSQIIEKDSGFYCQLTIKDNGIGFDEKYVDRIFQVFQRLHGRSEYKGTGIGLAICRKIVERHGGEITATSKPGNGTSFIVTLPVDFLEEF